MPREHGESGEFVETVRLQDVVRVFDEVRGPVILSADVADALDCSRETARRKLEELYEQGDADRRKVSRRVVYWRTGGDRITPDERAVEDHAEKAGTVRDRRREDTAEAPEGDRPPDVLEDVVDAVAEDILPGSGAKLDARREGLHAAVDYLREHGQATPSDFQTDVYPDHTGHYTDGDDPAYSWWTNCIYKGMRELSDRTDDLEKADTSGEWSWRGEDD